MPYIPYAWPEKGVTITVKSCQIKRINVWGLMNRRNELCYEIHRGIINSKIVI
ncbi:MAG: hypothetical protein F6K22_08230 [Okeania sp. SIO2F4]|uniref:hypothetical protein n=1 Tax=Okeania sp. SIO2F4 TaxID=2607790 RepID=UPI00142905C0|nr:hypothetical protein [Okeania sp. SIO2F4]NES02834.1 hypothetical protein [Okeania sp. SIO2F4]